MEFVISPCLCGFFFFFFSLSLDLAMHLEVTLMLFLPYGRVLSKLETELTVWVSERMNFSYILILRLRCMILDLTVFIYFYFNDYFNFSQSCCSYSDHSKIYVILFWYKSLLFFEFQIYVVGFLIGLHSVDVRYQHQVAEKRQLSLNPIYNVINAKWMFEEDIDAKWKLLLI